jgi:hypothetical protein
LLDGLNHVPFRLLCVLTGPANEAYASTGSTPA